LLLVHKPPPSPLFIFILIFVFLFLWCVADRDGGEALFRGIGPLGSEIFGATFELFGREARLRRHNADAVVELADL